jgi:peptidyl-prolyl cis-trans isomerase B (cyclophilin B)
MQGIAESFQSELLATANVKKKEGGYFLSLTIQNLYDHLVIYTKTLPCEGCTAFQVVDKLKELSGVQTASQVTLPSATDNADAPTESVRATDSENALWTEVQKGNSTDDYGAYLAQYPKGKYIALAKSRLKKLQDQEAANAKSLKEQADAKQVQQDQNAWDMASNIATEEGYKDYLDTYPKGRFAALAQARIAKIKNGTVQSAEHPASFNFSKSTLKGNKMVKLHTNKGIITLQLDAEKAPNTVKNFLDYVNSGFYSGTIFHRVIANFMIQGGGFEPGMTQKKTNAPIKNEAANGLKNDNYTVAMARTGDPHSATAQFFINVKDNGFLNYPGQDGWGYCVFGKVVEGKDVVDAIRNVKTGNRSGSQDVPLEDVIITKAEVVK